MIYFMKKTLLIVSALMLIVNLKSSGQNISIKGRVIDYELGHPIVGVYVTDNTIPLPGKNGIISDINGDFKIAFNTRSFVIFFIGYYSIKFTNIPIENKHIDFGDIKLVANHLMDDVVLCEPYKISDVSREEDKRLRKEVLKKYRIKVNGKKLKPHFEEKILVFDFDRNGKKNKSAANVD